MKKGLKKSLDTMFLSWVVLIFASLSCNAEDFSRSGRSEVFGSLQFMSGDSTTTGTPWGLMKIEVEDTVVFGIGYGYNINDHLNLNMDMLFGSTDIDGSLYSNRMKGDTSLVVLDINLDWNLLKTRLTPMVSGGAGVINFSGDIGNADFSESDFSFNLIVGFRWDASPHCMVKGGYKATWTELEDTNAQIRLDGVTLSAGYVF
jgi:hypothetical protein